MISRKRFLKTSAVAIAGVPFATLIQCNSQKNDVDPQIICATDGDILGPFYRANAPFRTALNVLQEAGTPIYIEGKVLGGKDCSVSLAEAIVDVWHTDDQGEYDISTSDYKFRGRIMTKEDGSYSFLSILPAPYKNGDQFRPKHIHFRVWADQHEELITQLYFEGDEFIADDPWARNADEDRIIKLEEKDGVLSGIFNIFLLQG